MRAPAFPDAELNSREWFAVVYLEPVRKVARIKLRNEELVVGDFDFEGVDLRN